jgi:hypothetical protein
MEKLDYGYIVKVYDVFNNTHEFVVESLDRAREYAKRIITEGLWLNLDETGANYEVFYPVHEIVKVKINKI